MKNLLNLLSKDENLEIITSIYSKEYLLTTNSSVYRKLHKLMLAQTTGICTRCPWHRSENREKTPHRSWKKYRKHQWKSI
jgi:hypothetical protein